MSYEPPVKPASTNGDMPVTPAKAFAGWSMKELLNQKETIEIAIDDLKANELAKIKASMAENGLAIEDIEPAASRVIGIATAHPAPSIFGNTIEDKPSHPQSIAAPGQSKSETKRMAAIKAPPKPGLKGSKLPIKYRNPKAVDETWTGRGRQPRWLVAAMKKAKVKTPESFAV